VSATLASSSAPLASNTGSHRPSPAGSGSGSAEGAGGSCGASSASASGRGARAPPRRDVGARGVRRRHAPRHAPARQGPRAGRRDRRRSRATKGPRPIDLPRVRAGDRDAALQGDVRVEAGRPDQHVQRLSRPAGALERVGGVHPETRRFGRGEVAGGGRAAAILASAVAVGKPPRRTRHSATPARCSARGGVAEAGSSRGSHRARALARWQSAPSCDSAWSLAGSIFRAFS
jgi:hypothetical protein